MRKEFYIALVVVCVLNVLFYFYWTIGLLSLFFFVPFFALGIRDIRQTRHAIKSNFPVFGHFRYLLESIRPEINQYFIESNTDGRPFSREQRSVVYQRAKKVLDTVPFGTQHDVYKQGYEFVTHSMYPKHVSEKDLRIMVGGEKCKQPYSLSLLNISAMSFGSLSTNAILSLNGGAKDGDFAHNTGEGGISPYHLEMGGDLIWQIGTGYFGCRTHDGVFDPELFKKNSRHPHVKMIEIKLSQGAKPGHGGILSGKKVTQEIANIRNVPLGKDVISPPGHSAFHDAAEMLTFIETLRELSGGKPVGIKLCLGHRREFEELVSLMAQKNSYPDFIAVDGAEGGTGAAPLEFSNYMGMPGIDALVIVVDTLKKFGVRDKVKVLATGKITTAFDIVKLLCIGADATYAARSMLLALGCIQALRCNNNKCPTGVATQDPNLVKGLHVPTKRERVKNFHGETLGTVAHIIGAMGFSRHQDLSRADLYKRIDENHIKTYQDLYPEPAPLNSGHSEEVLVKSLKPETV
ncbi:glutamate synthase [Bdellovibrio bacteriovorus]|uniref:Glutamate synthase n=1 Tax=Bdellovibrio bacteriovorus TaxID=959 RepID=A0A162GEU8_BDEBC|nr:FMN-binding glutamate synthase family protein [Bdellovibrio bacteriovorus]KYG67979.1 glutamate synthase [Bdellovibrio bacteriovorus]